MEKVQPSLLLLLLKAVQILKNVVTLLIALRIHHLLKLHFCIGSELGTYFSCNRLCWVKDLDVSKIQVWLDDVQICKDGGAAEDYTEEAGARVMAQTEITIRVDLGRGQAKDTVYTCDLSYDYVKINADYRS